MIYLHIGTDKTGSTAIQKLLHWNRARLLGHGILYPQAGVMHYDHARLKLALDAGDETPWQKLREEAAVNPDADVVLSHEGFYHLGSELIDRLREWLPEGDVRVILYIRRQDDMIESGMLQQIKTGERIPDLDGLGDEMPWWPHLDYAAVLARWGSVFGVGQLRLRPYGRSYLGDELAIYRDFISCLDRDEILLDSLDRPARDPNPSLDVASAHALMFLHRMGLAPKQHDATVDLLLHFQRKYGKSEARLFTVEQRRTLLARYAEGNRSILQLPFDLFSADDDEPSPVLREDEVTARLSHLYGNRLMLTGCREWYGEPGFVHLVESGRIQLKKGFYPLEKWGAWMRGDESSFMVFRVPRTMVGELELSIDLQYLPGVSTRSLVRIPDGPWNLLQIHTVLSIPPSTYLERFGLVFLEFCHLEPTSPASAGVSESDRRIMGGGIKQVAFVEIGNIKDECK